MALGIWAILDAVELQDILFSQGFGTRRVCAGLIQQGQVALYEKVGDKALICREVFADIAPLGLRFRVQGADWPYVEKAYLMLHKPSGIECSRRPSAYPGVSSLLPSPLRQRPNKGGTPGVQAVGRLDQDSTGLLLLSDDGVFIHRMTSPRHHVPKVYAVTLKHPAQADQIDRLVDGVRLEDDPKPVRAAACVQVADDVVHLTLTEGKYHQVKRMVAAVGNRVLALHRFQIGGLVLPPDLLPGQWRWLGDDALAQLHAGSDHMAFGMHANPINQGKKPSADQDRARPFARQPPAARAGS